MNEVLVMYVLYAPYHLRERERGGGGERGGERGKGDKTDNRKRGCKDEGDQRINQSIHATVHVLLLFIIYLSHVHLVPTHT